VKRYQRPLLHYLGRMGLTTAEAEELTQETFLRAYRHLTDFDSRRALFSTWLFTIARRLALNLLARQRHQIADCNDTVLQDSAAEFHEDYDRRVVTQRIHLALSQLPLKYRSPLSLVYLGDLSIAEIAQIEGCAEGTVKSRIHRAKHQLKTLLADLLGDDEHA
jgi:RNA polymerase sigma-70 factor (ECF subfamily)